MIPTSDTFNCSQRTVYHHFYVLKLKWPATNSYKFLNFFTFFTFQYSEEIEAKIPLLWVDILTMSLDYCEIDEACSGFLLHKFAQTLIACAEETEGSKWGRSLLGAIGIIKPTVSIQ